MIRRLLQHMPLLLLLLALLFPSTALAKGVVLNFADVDIATMVKFISDLTGRNFVMDERVKGKISVFSPSKLSPDEAFNVFTSVLELKGFTVIPSGKVFKIVPTAMAKQSGTLLLAETDRSPVNESYVARVIELKNISAQEATTFLQPLVAKDGHLSSFGPGNMILVVDSSLNIKKLLGILEIIDAPQSRSEAEVIYLQNAGADSVAGVVRDWLGGRAPKQTGQQPAIVGIGALVVPDTRLNALLVFGSDQDKEDVKKLVALIDVAPPTASSKVNVYYLEHANAVDTAKVLEGVIRGTQANPVAPGQAIPAQQSPFEGGKITITPDKATNSLVIMSSPTDYQNLVQVIQKLDRKRRQVFVEATFAEISLDKLKDLGVQWAFFGGISSGDAAVAGFYDPFGTLAPFLALLKSGTLGNDVTLTTAANFPVVLKALVTNGLAEILSTPTILTSDNKEAEIFVGENVPFITQSNLSSTGLSQQSIERKDTGIILRITPTISEGDYVRLDLYQEISAVQQKPTLGASDLITNKRSAKTGVVVKDGDTVVIGGLIGDRTEESFSQVPLLGDIPLLGWFFRYKNSHRIKTNLLITLRPVIVKDAQDLAQISERQTKKFNERVGKGDAPVPADKDQPQP